MDTITRKVNAGVKLLNRRNPGWYNKVKLTTLSLRNGKNCILGQLYGTFPEGIKAIIIKPEFHYNVPMNVALDAGARYGFSMTDKQTGRLNKKDYSLVQQLYKQYDEAWKTAIRKLRKAA